MYAEPYTDNEFSETGEQAWSGSNEILFQISQALIIEYERGTVLLGRDEEHWIMPTYVADEDEYELSFFAGICN